MPSRPRLRTAICAVVLLAVAAPAGAGPLESAIPPGLRFAAPVDGVLTKPAPTGPDARAMRGVLSNAARWIATAWWASQGSDLPRLVADADLMTPVKCERAAMAAYTLAVALTTGAFDPTATGVTPQEAAARARQVLTTLARTHRAADPRGWGHTWQSALWAALGAHAAWLLGPALSDVDRLLVARMLESEADAVVARPMHHLRDRSGRLRTPGNTGAEELAWDGMVLQVGVSLLPAHAHRALWADAAHRRMVNAFARPQDVRDRRVVNGRRVTDWLAGSNAEPSGLVVNHGRVFPDYSTTINENLFAVTVYPLVGLAVPDAARYNVDVVYAALSTVGLHGPPYRAPGGTAYVRRSAEIYYPQGTVWGYRRQMCFAALDVQVAALDLDRLSPVPARVWARRHLGVVRAMQARFPDGHTFARGEDRFWLQEEWIGMQSAMAYMTQWVSSHRLVRWHNRPGVVASAPAA
ncbi:MAG TPA: hypothetical protein VNA12_05615 [Mycobacteriales bacterium]|nr:hypothetical protein [Mycobacteriales bacterium]